MSPCTKPKMYGYARVSTKDQNLARQLDALLSLGIKPTDIFADKASGKDFNRPEYRRLIRRIRPGDVVVVKSIDRLGRDYGEIIEEWRRLTKEKRAAVVVIDMPLLDTRESHPGITGVFISDIVLQLLSYVAQVERENIMQRQAEGIASAKARGVRFGRPPLKRPQCYEQVRDMYLIGEITRKESAERLGVCLTTFDRWLQADGKRKNCKKSRR